MLAGKVLVFSDRELNLKVAKVTRAFKHVSVHDVWLFF